jgi:hypothetical protein
VRGAIGVFLALALIAAAFLITRDARSEEIPRGLGHDDITHSWVGSDCCGRDDCEPIPFEAVQQRTDGSYSVVYRTSRGFTARGVVRQHDVKPSKDPQGRPVGCAMAPDNEGRGFVGEVPGNLICLYFNPTM